MSAPARHPWPRVLACLWWLIATLMAAAFIRVPHSDIGFIAVASPYAFLAGAWVSYQRLSQLLESKFTGPLATLTLLQERLAILAMFAFCGIGIAMLMGVVMRGSVTH